jgi:hypothetical protein
MERTTKKIRCPACGAAPGKMCRSLESDKPLPDCHAARRLISINEAVKLGAPRLRKPVWANPLDHLKIDIVDGRLGPWLHLYCPFNKPLNGRDPVDMMALQHRASLDTPEFEVYAGPNGDSDEYLAEVQRCEAQVSRCESAPA